VQDDLMNPDSPGPQHRIDRRQVLRGALAATLPIAFPASAATAKPLSVAYRSRAT
jgi:hypothetical protein